MFLDLTGETVFLLGGGPSLRDALQTLAECPDENRKVFAINDSICSYPDANLLFFRDPSWYLANRNTLETWNGVLVTSVPATWYSLDVNVIKMKHVDDFVIGEDYIKYGRSAGHIALSLAISLGAKRCILLGYECKNVDGRSHYSRQKNSSDAWFRTDFLPAWRGWGAAADRAGVEVYNATPDTAITEFPSRPLVELLNVS